MNVIRRRRLSRKRCLYVGCRRSVVDSSAWCRAHFDLLMLRVISGEVGQERRAREAARR